MKGETYAILRHIVGECRERIRLEGDGDGGESGERERRRDGIIYSCCEIADRIYRRQRKWTIGRRENRRWKDGMFLYLFFFSFSVVREWIDAAVLEHSMTLSFQLFFLFVFPRRRLVPNIRSQLLSNRALP